MHDKLDAAPRSTGPATLTMGHASPSVPLDLARVVGENLRRLRTKRGLSLQRLSRASGVSRAMLSQVASSARSSLPTVNIIWKISQALAVSVTALLTDARRTASRRSFVRPPRSSSRRTTAWLLLVARAVPLSDGDAATDFYELRLAPASTRGSAGSLSPGNEGESRGRGGHVAHRHCRTSPPPPRLAMPRSFFDADLATAHCNDGADASSTLPMW